MFLFLLSGTVYGEEVIYTRLSIDDGLASNFVRCSWQSPDGYLWIGTENGLQRYDGNSFVNPNRKMHRDNVPALPVLQILESSRTEVWLHVGGYFGRFDPYTMRFKKAKLSLDGQYTDLSVARLIAGKNGDVFLLLPGYKLLCFNRRMNQFEDRFGLSALNDFHPLGVEYLVASNQLLMAGEKGIGLFDLNTNGFYTPAHNPIANRLLWQARNIDFIHNVGIADHGRIWLIARERAGVINTYLYEPESSGLKIKKTQREETSYEFSFNGVSNALGRSWIYGAGLFNYYDQRNGMLAVAGHPFLDYYGIQFNTIHHIYGDRDNHVWIATDNGLYKGQSLTNSIFHGYVPKLKNFPISQVLQADQGLVKILSRGQGIVEMIYTDSLGLMDRGYNKAILKKASEKGSADYKTIYGGVITAGKVFEWFGCRGGKLIRYDRKTRAATYFAPAVFRDENILHLLEDQQGRIWFGTEKGSLIYYGEGRFSLFSRVGSGINKLMLASDGKIWIATEHSGAVIIDPQLKVINKLYNSTSGDGLSANNPINDIIEVNPALFVLGCSGSLNLIDIRNNKQQIFTGNNGLPANIIYSVQKDQFGKLWMATNGGLFRYDIEDQSFYGREGLVRTTNQWNVFTTSTRLNGGRLLFAGPNSILIFDPEKISDQKKPNPIAITDFKLFNQYLSVDSILKGREVRLAHNENSISISFSAFNFDRDDKFRYYYRLEGADTTWIKADKYLTASFSSLAPGKYVFVVKSQNPNDHSYANFMRLPIVIKPAYWQTWWFKILFMLIIVLPVYIIYKLRVRRILDLQRLRENVARDLHDDVGSTLTSINILSEMAAMQTKRSPVMAEEYMMKISKNSSDMMQAMDDIIWSIKPANDSLAKMVARMREYMGAVLESKRINCQFKIAEQIERSKLSMEQRKGVFLVYKEAVNNIAKYANASEVDVKINVDAGVLSMSIADNGIGISSLRSRNGNGLDNMQQRIEQLKGTFHISSLEGKGTTISFSININ